jgi:hypothetical protein
VVEEEWVLPCYGGYMYCAGSVLENKGEQVCVVLLSDPQAWALAGRAALPERDTNRVQLGR